MKKNICNINHELQRAASLIGYSCTALPIALPLGWCWCYIYIYLSFVSPLHLHLVTSKSCNHDNITKRITNWWANIFWVTYAQESRYICFIQYSVLIFFRIVNDMICPNYIISRENWNWWMWASINLIWLMLSEPQHIQCSIMFKSRNSHFRTFWAQECRLHLFVWAKPQPNCARRDTVMEIWRRKLISVSPCVWMTRWLIANSVDFLVFSKNIW